MFIHLSAPLHGNRYSEICSILIILYLGSSDKLSDSWTEDLGWTQNFGKEMLSPWLMREHGTIHYKWIKHQQMMGINGGAKKRWWINTFTGLGIIYQLESWQAATGKRSNSIVTQLNTTGSMTTLYYTFIDVWNTAMIHKLVSSSSSARLQSLRICVEPLQLLDISPLEL